MRILLDGAIVGGADGTSDDARLREYWPLLIAWEGDRRTFLGQETWCAIMDRFGKEGYPRCGPYPARDTWRAINALLTRVREPVRVCVSAMGCEPTYKGPAFLGEALLRDCLASVDRTVLGVGSARSSWSDGWVGVPECVTVRGDDAMTLEVAFSPNAVFAGEAAIRTRLLLSGKRVRVVGGKRAAAIEERLADGLEVVVDWLECEKGKSPDFGRLRGLSATRDLVVIITGFIGHSESGKAEGLAVRAECPVLHVETPQGVLGALVETFGGG